MAIDINKIILKLFYMGIPASEIDDILELAPGHARETIVDEWKLDSKKHKPNPEIVWA